MTRFSDKGMYVPVQSHDDIIMRLKNVVIFYHK